MVEKLKRAWPVLTFIGSFLLVLCTVDFADKAREYDGTLYNNLVTLGWSNPPKSLATTALSNWMAVVGGLILLLSVCALISRLLDRRKSKTAIKPTKAQDPLWPLIVCSDQMLATITADSAPNWGNVKTFEASNALIDPSLITFKKAGFAVPTIEGTPQERAETAREYFRPLYTLLRQGHLSEAKSVAKAYVRDRNGLPHRWPWLVRLLKR